MHNDQGYYKELLTRYFSGDLAAGELEELVAFVREQPEQFEAVAAEQEFEAIVLVQSGRLHVDLPVEVRQRMRARTMASVEEMGGIVMPMRRRRTGWWAAAVVVGLVGIGVWVWLGGRNASKRLETPPVATHDVLPGGNRAVLTLANGSTIVLDSAHVGTVSQQAGATVVKTDSGELKYTTLGGKPAEVVWNTLATPRGGQYQLVLPDGTHVWLNAESSIRYPVAFGGDRRTVEVTGEAYFEVAHDAAKPFKVKAGGETIEDIGTGFNVNAYMDEDAVRTTLVEGAVDVDRVRLRPGEQAVGRAGGKIRVKKDADLEDVLAWKNGRFRFEGAEIQSILRQAERWYDVTIEYKGKINETFSGGISRHVNASQLLHILELTGKVTFTIEGKKIIVMPK